MPSVVPRLDAEGLARRAKVTASAVTAFEAGQGGLGVAALMRIAGELGVPRPADGFTPAPAPERDAHLPGYAAAIAARNLLARPGPLRSLARLLEDQFDVLVLRHRFADERVLGAACRSGPARLVAVNLGVASETARRFALAHELGHHLLDLDVAGVTADEVPGRDARAWFEKKPAEKRADAFAAMFLAPTAAVAEVAGPPRGMAGYEEAKAMVDRVRAHVGMGYSATAWHLHNLGYFSRDLAEMFILGEPEADMQAGFEEDTRFDGLERRVLEALAGERISRGRGRELLGGRDPEALAATP